VQSEDALGAEVTKTGAFFGQVFRPWLPSALRTTMTMVSRARWVMDLEKLLGKVSDGNGARSFGPVIERGDVLIIPVSFVAGGGGAGTAEPEPNSSEKSSSSEPRGSGGGFGGLIWPLGVYVLKDGRVRWSPAFDPMLVVFAALTMLRLAVRRSPSRRVPQVGPNIRRLNIVNRPHVISRTAQSHEGRHHG
jgi:hypothetical protein